MGDPIFDRFYASTVPSLASFKEATVKMKNVGPALLDKIGVRFQSFMQNVHWAKSSLSQWSF
jgi:hypothetical protein